VILQPRSAQDLGESSDGQESGLWARVKAGGDSRAREALFEIYMPLAKRIAKRHFLDRQSGDIDFLELCQLAYAGLLEAIDRFNPGFGAPFRSFASRRISGSLLDGIAKLSERREQLSFRSRVRSDRARSLAQGLEAKAADPMQSFVDLAVGLALSFMLEDTALYVSHDKPDPGPDAYDSLAWKEAITRVMTEVRTLPERDSSIVRMHYIEGLDFEQIAKVLQLSKGRISQLHKSALGLLRKRLSALAEFNLTR
jgi:RNA polymerase sigma factor for flagellar operon FliA